MSILIFYSLFKFVLISEEYLNGPSTKNIAYNHSRDSTLSDTLDLGPLPPKWEKAYTKNGEVYFIE
jgi:hypothetical protein